MQNRWMCLCFILMHLYFAFFFLPLSIAIILTIAAITLGQQESFLRKPWPQYSLHNMPKTQFTCHDKILGGYYADPEAQCQMFHVCVKVAGVGVSYVCTN